MTQTTEADGMNRQLLIHFQYCLWRLEMWTSGYGTYDDIDRAVSEGKLKPGVIPPKAERPDASVPIPPDGGTSPCHGSEPSR